LTYNERSDVVENLVNSDLCVVSFSSNENEFSVEMPHFEFRKTLDKMGVAYVLLRDSTDTGSTTGLLGSATETSS
jgi:hypothetical protein